MGKAKRLCAWLFSLLLILTLLPVPALAANAGASQRLDTPVVQLSNQTRGIRVSWSKVEGAKQYVVTRRSEKGSWQILKTLPASKNAWLDPSVRNQEGARFQYAVRAVNGSKKSGVQPKQILRLKTPTVTSVVNNKPGGADVRWTTTSAASGYILQLEVNGRSKRFVFSGSHIYAHVYRLTKGFRYAFSIQSYCQVGYTRYFSAWSNPQSVQIAR